jgi:predicted nucleic acid-binding protein
VNTIVLDASVAAKWFLPAAGETLVKEATALLDRYAKGEIRFLVPDLFWAEIGNILWKAVRQNRCTEDSAEKAISSLVARKLPTVSSEQLLPGAFAIATTFDRTVYDSIYVALAITSKSQLVTADERLANALAARLPVKWLGAF